MRHLRMASTLAATVLMTVVVGGIAPDAKAAPAATAWTAAWTSAMQEAKPFGQASNESCRNISRMSAAGTSVRVHLSNAQVTAPVTFDAASVGIRVSGPSIKIGTLRMLTFGGSPSVTVPAGGEAVSDPVPLAVAVGTDVAVTTYVAGSVPAFPNHVHGLVSHYCTALDGSGGDQTANLAGQKLTGVSNNVPWVEGIDVRTAATGTIVAFGDSITDGLQSGINAYANYPDDLITRLHDNSIVAAVVNEGIGGNTILGGGKGPTGLTRFAHDATAQPEARVVLLLEGTNDIALDASAQSVENGLTTLAQDAHAAGLRIVVGTIIPRHGAPGWTDAKDAVRAQVNAFIRSSSAFDAVVDFDASLKNQDPDYPAANTPNYQEYLAQAYDSGDHIHPNRQGYLRMSNLFDLTQLGQWVS